jgi:hypothetical protein
MVKCGKDLFQGRVRRIIYNIKSLPGAEADDRYLFTGRRYYSLYQGMRFWILFLAKYGPEYPKSETPNLKFKLSTFATDEADHNYH